MKESIRDGIPPAFLAWAACVLIAWFVPLGWLMRPVARAAGVVVVARPDVGAAITGCPIAAMKHRGFPAK